MPLSPKSRSPKSECAFQEDSLGGWYACSNLKGSEEFTQVASYHFILKSLCQIDFLLQLPSTLCRHYQSMYIGTVKFDRNLWILSVFNIAFLRTVVGCIYFKLYCISNTIWYYISDILNYIVCQVHNDVCEIN